MRKTLVGIVAAAIIIGTGAYFGSKLWAQLQAKNEIEAAFESLRGTFTTVSHGKVDLDATGRNVRMPDIILQSSDKTTTVKFEQVAAYGTLASASDRVTADRIEIVNLEFTTTLPLPSAPQITYRVPKVVIEGYSGPSSMPRRSDTAAAADVARSTIEYLAASTAKTITIPKLTVNITPTSANDPLSALGPIEYIYTDIVFHELRDRRIGEMSVERVTVTSEKATPELGTFAAAMAKMSIVDFNLDAIIAILDPARSKDDNYIQMYRKTSMGPIEFRFAKGVGMQMDEIVAEDIGVRPSKMSISNFLAMTQNAPKPGTQATPEQTRMMLDQLANIYEGIKMGKMEMRGMRTDVGPDASVKIAAIRLTGYDNGRLGEFAIEGVDGTTPQKDPFHLGRFALKGLHIANMMRQSAKFADIGAGKPSIEQSLGMLALLEAIEIDDVSATNPLLQQKVRIDTFRISWGKFVGAIPSTVRLTTKTTIPSSLADQGLGILSDAGLPNITTSVDFGVAWDESTQTLLLSPADIAIENAFTFGAKFSILNFTRGMFSTDPNQVMAAGDLAQFGPLELTLRDTGAVTTALAQYAKNKSLSPEDARKEIIESVTKNAKSGAQSNPDSLVVGQAIAQFIETPGATLTIKVTPKGRVFLKQAFGAAAGDPMTATAMFAIEAQTTK